MPQNSILPVFLFTFFEFLIVERVVKLRYLWLVKFGLRFCGLEFFSPWVFKILSKKKLVLLRVVAILRTSYFDKVTNQTKLLPPFHQNSTLWLTADEFGDFFSDPDFSLFFCSTFDLICRRIFWRLSLVTAAPWKKVLKEGLKFKSLLFSDK